MSKINDYIENVNNTVLVVEGEDRKIKIDIYDDGMISIETIEDERKRVYIEKSQVELMLEFLKGWYE